MSSVYGKALKLSIFGESHSAAIGMTLDGIPAGFRIKTDELREFMSRRSAARYDFATTRHEADIPEFLCGIENGTTCGTPITAIIRNEDIRKADYENIRAIPRPGHADYTSYVKYGGNGAGSGGGHASGRITAALCAAGGICMQILAERGISVISRIRSIGNIADIGELTDSTAHKSFPTVDEAKGAEMQRLIREAKGDSCGGIIECHILGVPAGVGDPIFDGMENRIASVIFAVPAVKGIEFGAGFAGTRLRGSEFNDAFRYDGGCIVTETNNCGGILGGIADGMPICFNTAIKPTPSISVLQRSVDINKRENAELLISGRHDACIVPRVVPCIEAAAAIAVYDAILEWRNIK